MKILHVTKKYPDLIGGDSFVVYNLKLHQEKSGHAVFILASNCDEITQKEIFKFGIKQQQNNLDRVTFRRIISLFLLPLWGFKNLKQIGPDIINSHSADLGFFISIPARVFGIPIVNTCHGISFNDKQFSILKRFAEKLLLKYAGFEKIITVDPQGLEVLRRENMERAVYISNGIDLEKFRGKEVRNNSKIMLLFAGRLEKQKGVTYLLEAAGQLKGNVDFKLVIVGDGSERKSLEELSHEFHLDDLVIFKGKIDEESLLRYYQECDVFILPSVWEGMPLTLLEAAAAGMAIIATKVGGISSVFTHEANALLVEPGNADAIAGAIQKLIKDPVCMKTLGENVRRVAERFSWETTAGELEKVYSDIIEHRSL